MWCATCDGHTVVGGICHFQTIAAALLLAAAVAQGSWHVRRISLLQRVRYRPLTREKGEHLFQPRVCQYVERLGQSDVHARARIGELARGEQLVRIPYRFAS